MSDPNKCSPEVAFIALVVIFMLVVFLAGFAWEAGEQFAWLMFDLYKESKGIPLG